MAAWDRAATFARASPTDRTTPNDTVDRPPRPAGTPALASLFSHMDMENLEQLDHRIGSRNFGRWVHA